MATITSNQSGNWGDTSTWVGGVLPVDGDDIVISAGHSVKMNVNQSAWTGLRGIVIQGSSGTPGMLYFMNGTSGHLKQRSTFTITGTAGTNKGRLLVNSDGIWGNTGALAFADKAIIISSQINGTYLDIRAYCTPPTIKYAFAYQTRYVVTVSGNTFTGATLTEGTTIMFTSTGTLPSPLQPYVAYKAKNVSGNTFQIGYPFYGPTHHINSLTAVLTGVGSGTIYVYVPCTTATTYNIIDTDLTTDTQWSSSEPSQVLIHTIVGNYFGRVITTLTAVTSTSITITTGVVTDPIVTVTLLSYNVSFRHSYVNTTTHFLINLVDCYIHADVRQVSSTGAYNSPSYQAICFKSPVNTTIKGLVAFFSTLIELNSKIPDIEAMLCIGTAIGSPNEASYFEGQVFTGVVIGCSICFRGLISPDITCEAYGCGYLHANNINVHDTGDYKNVLYVLNTCRNSSFVGSIHGTQCPLYTCENSYADIDCSNAAAIASSEAPNCITYGTATMLHSFSYTPGYPHYQNRISMNVDDANLGFHMSSGDLALENMNLTFPLRSIEFRNPLQNTNDNRLRCDLKLENINNTDAYDGMYTAGGKVVRVEAGEFAYVPSTSYDGINKFLMVTDLTVELNRIRYVPIIKDLKVWCEAGIRTLTVPLVSTFTTLSGDDLELQVDYELATGYGQVKDSSVPSTATDWSQNLEVTFTLARSGFVNVRLTLVKYEAGARLFVYPWPVVT